VAEDLTFGFEAEVEKFDDVYGTLGGTIEEGDVLSGTYRYDTEAPDVFPDPDDETRGWYEWYEPPNGIRVTGGGHVFESASDPAYPLPLFDVEIHDRPEGEHDYLRLTSGYGILKNSEVVCEESYPVLAIYYNDPNGTALTSDELPTQPLNSDPSTIFQLYVTCKRYTDEPFVSVMVIAELTDTWLVTETLMEQLQAEVDALVEAELLTEEQAFGLMQKGWEANAKFTSDVGADKTDQACNQMEAFLNQLEAFIPKFLLEEDVAEIRRLVDDIMTEEGCFIE
jgi:hypothetical protein